ncbi:MAG TPA: nucleotide sugar dehydrogenase [Candidatus Thermoplasmatota archaeon]|nr:nucleotide sugar dehydrogenase [Candidatus Thermoplasmatota archaeon]
MTVDILVLGGGFVGSVMATVLAESGHRVQLLEADPARRQGLRKGTPHFEEPGLAQALGAQVRAGLLEVPESLQEARVPQVAIVCVGTPPAPDGSADLSQVLEASRDAARKMGSGVLAVKSTVPPGTLRGKVAPAVASVAPGVRCASLPEFLAEGDALRGARKPERVVIGTDHPEAADVLAAIHGSTGAAILRTDPTTAEATKYCANAMLAIRVGAVNELADVCAAVGVDVDEVMRGVGMDPRIGSRYLVAGLGFGGSCFPKDVSALLSLANEQGVGMPLLSQVLQSNHERPALVVDMLERELGTLRGKQVALLGLSFKPGTSDLRESRAVAVHRQLRKRGAMVVAHDPAAAAQFRREVPEAVLVAEPKDALHGADGCIIGTAWDVYRELDWARLAGTMREPVIVDAWRVVDPHGLPPQARYRAIGRGVPAPALVVPGGAA